MTGNQRPATRDQKELNGVIVVNKPADITSAGVVARVKHISNAKKVGHTGTLDPFARGVLVCCLNKATRLARFLLHGNKTYEAVLKLGEETDTLDSTGSAVAVGNTATLSQETIRLTVRRFVGSIEQLPPVFSALKHKGVPLYKLARRGQPIQKPPRRVHILDIEIREINIPFIRFEVTCSAGTYIRTLCADIGTSLGCGGHLHALKRLESSGFTIHQALTLTQIEEFALAGTLNQQLIGMSDALSHMPGVTADTTLITKIRHGHMLTQNDVNLENIFRQNKTLPTYIKIVDAGNNLIAVMEHKKAKGRLDYCCVLIN